VRSDRRHAALIYQTISLETTGLWGFEIDISTYELVLIRCK